MKKAVLLAFPILYFSLSFSVGNLAFFSLKAVTCFKVKHINYLSIL